MADTFTSRGDITKPEVGVHNNDWGAVLNANFDTIDQMIAGLYSRAIAGGTEVLTQQQHNCRVQAVSGVLLSNHTMQILAKQGWWFVRNTTTGAFTVTVKTFAGAGVVCGQGATTVLYCDGVDCFQLNV